MEKIQYSYKSMMFQCSTIATKHNKPSIPLQNIQTQWSFFLEAFQEEENWEILQGIYDPLIFAIRSMEMFCVHWKKKLSDTKSN